MILITSENPQLKALPLENVRAYVLKSGWQHVSHPNLNLMVFQGANDDLGQPIQLVLPQSVALWDSSILLAKAINLLAEIEKQTPEEILAAIHSDNDLATGLTVQDFIQRRKQSPHPEKREQTK